MTFLWIYLTGFALWYMVGIWLGGANDDGLLKAMLIGCLMGGIWPFCAFALVGIVIFERAWADPEFWSQTFWNGFDK